MSAQHRTQTRLSRATPLRSTQAQPFTPATQIPPASEIRHSAQFSHRLAL